MSTQSTVISDTNITWELPSRGRVGMFCLISAESAIFTIFVVAYLFYVGKSLTGPTPRDVLHAPIFFTICLLSSSLTIHLDGSSRIDSLTPTHSTNFCRSCRLVQSVP